MVPKLGRSNLVETQRSAQTLGAFDGAVHFAMSWAWLDQLVVDPWWFLSR